MSDEIRAKHASDLLENPVFLEALEQVNRGISREMDKVADSDLVTMQSLVMQRKAANRIVQHINRVRESPKVTEFNARPKKSLFRS